MTVKKCYLENQDLTREQYNEGTNLTAQQKALIREEDVPYIAFIENIFAGLRNIGCEHLRNIGGAFVPRGSEQASHYDALHSQWILCAADFLACQLKRTPNLGEVFRNLEENLEPFRFCAYYTLRHPENVKWNDSRLDPDNTDAVFFLGRAAVLFPEKNYSVLIEEAERDSEARASRLAA